MKLTHFGAQRGLVAHGGGHPAQERRNFGARLSKPEDVVDEEQHVLLLHVTEVLGNRQSTQAHAEAGSRRLVHLAITERGGLEHTRLLHLHPEVVPLTSPFTHAAENGSPAVLHRDVVDKLHDDDGLADTSTAEETGLATFDVRSQQVDDLNARLEDFGLRLEFVERGG